MTSLHKGPSTYGRDEDTEESLLATQLLQTRPASGCQNYLGGETGHLHHLKVSPPKYLMTRRKSPFTLRGPGRSHP